MYTSKVPSVRLSIQKIKLVVYEEIIEEKKTTNDEKKKVECLLPNPTNRKLEQGE